MKHDLKKIIEFRKLKKISIKRFAERLGVTTKTIYNWENNVTKPGKVELLAIAHVLNINVSEISDIKESGLHYIKPGLKVKNTIHDGVKLLKNIIEDSNCGDYVKLLPLLNAEEELYKLNIENTRLLEKVSQLKSIIDSIDIPIYIKNNKRIVTYVNQALINILPAHLTETDILGHKFHELISFKEYEGLLKLENNAFEGIIINKVPVKFPLVNKNFNVSIKAAKVKNDKVSEILVHLL